MAFDNARFESFMREKVTLLDDNMDRFARMYWQARNDGNKRRANDDETLFNQMREVHFQLRVILAVYNNCGGNAEVPTSRPTGIMPRNLFRNEPA